MVLPVSDQAAQQVGAAQQRAVRSRAAAERDVVAAAAASVTAIEHEFLSAQSRLPRFFVQRSGVGHQFTPGFCGMNIDFDDAGVGCYTERSDTRFTGRAVTFEPDPQFQRCSRVFDQRQQIEIGLDGFERRHEYIQPAVTHFDAQRGADEFFAIGGFFRQYVQRQAVAER